MNPKLSAELDLMAQYEWHMENLLCLRCHNRWSNAYSYDFVEDHPDHNVITCLRCGTSTPNVVPASN